MSSDRIQREVLPLPDRPYEGLITYDAKDPDTSGSDLHGRRFRFDALVREGQSFGYQKARSVGPRVTSLAWACWALLARLPVAATHNKEDDPHQDGRD